MFSMLAMPNVFWLADRQTVGSAGTDSGDAWGRPPRARCVLGGGEYYNFSLRLNLVFILTELFVVASASVYTCFLLTYLAPTFYLHTCPPTYLPIY